MRTRVLLNLEGKHRFVGLLSADRIGALFQYAPEFVAEGLEVSPLSCPLRASVFRCIPGFVSDSLPDGWGNILLSRRHACEDRRLAEMAVSARLAGIGNQGVGALEFEPETSNPKESCRHDSCNTIDLDAVADGIRAVQADEATDTELDELIRLSGYAGGARPKIVCLVSDDKRLVKPGNAPRPNGAPWIIKFSNLTDPEDSGALEYAVSLLAKSADIDMPETHLFESSKGAGWFGIRRFDRTSSGKVHMATAAGLLHCDFWQPCLDYQTLMALTQRLAGAGDLEQMLKRAYFNFVIDNRDDHAKNFSFLMDGKGRWRLSPAYDLVPCAGGFEHMTALMGVGKSPVRSLFVRLGEDFGLSHRKAQTALAAVDESLSQWHQLAKNCGVKSPPVFAPLK